MGESESESIVHCPRCGAEVPAGSGARGPYFPFCSRTCKLVDLGNWLDERYAITEDRGGRSQGGGDGEEEANNTG